MTSDLETSYRHCRAVVRRASSNLASTFWLLPPDQRRGMDALYAFARQADDLVDSDEPIEVRRKQLAAFRRVISIRLTGEDAGAYSFEPRGPLALLPALEHTVRRFGIASKLLLELLDGMDMDLDRASYADFGELREYCYRAASVIGLACLPIWGCRDERALAPANDCGLGFQLTNILRDLREDAERGRCYLPTGEMERFGVAPADILSGANDTGWNEFLQFQVARAEHFFESGAETGRYLPLPGRRVFALMVARYRGILSEVKRRSTGILRERIQLSFPRKLLIAVRAMWGSGRVSVAQDKPSLTNRIAKMFSNPARVAIVGGGLAGLAAAAELCERGYQVELLEAKRRLGGRAGSYLDQETGQPIDHCQHVAMGCCTSFLDFCRRTGILELFERHSKLHFFGPEGKRCDFAAYKILPAPFHLGPAFLGLSYLSLGERLSIASSLWKLSRRPATEQPGEKTIGAWLADQRQSPRSIERFWQVVLVSALGESLDRASLTAARKVFVDGFLSSPEAGEVWIPSVPLAELYHRIAAWLTKRGVVLSMNAPVERIEALPHDAGFHLHFKEGPPRQFDFVLCAVPWRAAATILPPEVQAALPEIYSSPITSLHLWFDRPLTELPHAVLVGRLSQWVFAKKESRARGQESGEHYYQVVISASRELAGRHREDVLREVRADLNGVFPTARDAALLRWRMITEHEAVFSVRPGLEAVRPAQETSIPGLFLAGDWTATGWPSTMESAVRSGRLAAKRLASQVTFFNLGRSG